MSVPSLILKRNLRKSLLQGNPWIYKNNLSLPKEAIPEFVAWGIFSKEGPLTFRLLSLDKNPPQEKYFEETLSKALDLRSKIISSNTTAYRLINGEGDFMPGLICDVYGDVAVLQFDGPSMYEFWDQDFLSSWILKNLKLKTIYFKPRHDSQLKPKTWGEPLTSNIVQCKENGLEFLVDIVEGQKTGFFLDQRDNRKYLSHIAKDQTVLNLFSYSGGFSVHAGSNFAKSVTSVDIAQGALDLSQKIWSLNKFSTEHKTICADVFEYLNSDSQKFDIVICDPPSLAKSESQKELAMNKYIEVFSLAAKKVKSGGHLVLSSCSSHIHFDDFEIIVNEALSKARKRGQTLRLSGQGADHPYPQACAHLRYLKFIDLIIQD
jgi:23S rRNA (cytosine1962-C5)-methyltransferase